MVELMGPPEFERFEPPARIWQCGLRSALWISFYMMTGKAYRGVCKRRMRGAGRSKLNDRECFASTIRPAQNNGVSNIVDPNERGARVGKFGKPVRLHRDPAIG